MTQAADPLWDELFPFRLTFDDDLRFKEFGLAIAKMLPDLKVDARLPECFELKRPPRVALTREVLVNSARRLFVLRERSRGIFMRGQIVRDAARGVYHFLGSPWVDHPDDLKGIGVSVRDYAPHDGTVDYLFALSLKATTLAQLGTAYEKLTRSEESFRSLIEGSPDAMAVHRDGRLVYVNPALVAVLGYERVEELVGRQAADIIHPDDRQAVMERARTTVAPQERPLQPSRFEERYLRKDGSVITLEVAALPLIFDGEPAVVSIARDITDRKRAEDLQNRLAHADRLAAVGRLAAGVAHEVNNPATYILTNLQLLLDHVEQLWAGLQQVRDTAAHPAGGGTEKVQAMPERYAVESRLADMREMLEDCLDGMKRIVSIVGDLRVFSRLERDEVELVDINQVVHTACNIAFNEIRHRARLVKDLGRVPQVVGDRGKLCQVLLNLLVNAAYAIPEADADYHKITVTTAYVDGSIKISVEDSGLRDLRGPATADFRPLLHDQSAVRRHRAWSVSVCRDRSKPRRRDQGDEPDRRRLTIRCHPSRGRSRAGAAATPYNVPGPSDAEAPSNSGCRR